MSDPQIRTALVEPTVGTVRVVDGQRMEDGSSPLISAPPDGSPRASDERLFVLIHLAGQALEIGDEGMRQAGSLVGGRATRPAPAGICNLSAHASRDTRTAGVPAGLGQCAAPADIPFGSKIYIPALGETFVVTDRTHERFRRSTVDLFMPSKAQCRNFGCQYLECEITPPG